MQLFGRGEEVEMLVNWMAGIEATSGETNVCAISVEGPLGVGKTALVDEAARQVAHLLGNTVTVQTSSIASGADVPQWIAQQVLSKRSALGADDALRRRMRETSKLCAELTQVVATGRSALGSDSARLQTATAAAVLELGSVATITMGKQLAAQVGIKLGPEEVQQLQPALDAMAAAWARYGAGWVSRLLGRKGGSVALNPAELLAERLAADLSAVAKQRTGIRRLLFVLDDYDQQIDVIGHFVVRHLLGRLERLEIPVAFVFCGTTPLRSTDPHWQRTLARFQSNGAGRRELVLGPLSRGAVADFAQAHGIPADLHERLRDETGGYPWLIEQAIREIRENARHAIGFLGDFVDRLTEDMDEKQTDWFFRLCFVGQVVEDTVALVTEPGEEPAKVVDWFRRNAAVCRRDSVHYEVWPYIRYRVLDFLWRTKDRAWWHDLARRAGLGYQPGQVSGTSIVMDLKRLSESGLLNVHARSSS